MGYCERLKASRDVPENVYQLTRLSQPDLSFRQGEQSHSATTFEQSLNDGPAVRVPGLGASSGDMGLILDDPEETAKFLEFARQ